jgi:hypothetical protein
MKNNRGMYRIIPLLLFLLLSTVTLNAKGNKMNFTKQIRTLKMISTATVVLVPPDVFYRVRLDEARLREFGCTYVSQDKSHIARLVDILTRTNIRAVSSLEGSWEIRKGIFLKLEDGSEVKLLLEKESSNYNTIRGEFTNPSIFDKLPVAADVSLLKKIYKWAAQADVPADKVDNNERNCGSFIRGYKHN